MFLSTSAFCAVSGVHFWYWLISGCCVIGTSRCSCSFVGGHIMRAPMATFLPTIPTNPQTSTCELSGLFWLSSFYHFVISKQRLGNCISFKALLQSWFWLWALNMNEMIWLDIWTCYILAKFLLYKYLSLYRHRQI